MTLDLTAALIVFLAVAVWQMLRRRNPRSGGPLPDVPDASPTAVAVQVPGLTLPDSSLDPFAPPKQRGDRRSGDGAPWAR